MSEEDLKRAIEQLTTVSITALTLATTAIGLLKAHNFVDENTVNLLHKTLRDAANGLPEKDAARRLVQRAHEAIDTPRIGPANDAN